MVTVIIQARTGSTRLPGKVLKKVLGKTILELMVERVKRAKTIDKIVIATTDRPADKKIADLARKLGLDFYRGSENDLLDRYYQTAKKFNADFIVRLSSDCPLIDHEVIDKVAGFYLKNKKNCDYVSNTYPATYPDGMDTEVFSFKALKEAWQKADLPSEREHLTQYIRNHPEKFKKRNVRNAKDLHRLRLTLDNPEDFILIKKIFTALYAKNKYFGLGDILDFLEKNPKLALINSHLERNEGLQKSLREDPKSIIAVLGGALIKDESGWRTTHFNEGDNFGASGDWIRTVAAHYLYEDYKILTSNLFIVVSGGRGQLESVPDAPALADILCGELLELGIPADRIFKENQSGNTFQQLRELSRLIFELNFGKITVISNRWHLPRISAMIARVPALASLRRMKSDKNLVLESAEEIVLKHDRGRFGKIIADAYQSKEMQERIRLEKAGVAAIKAGTYK